MSSRVFAVSWSILFAVGDVDSQTVVSSSTAISAYHLNMFFAEKHEELARYGAYISKSTWDGEELAQEAFVQIHNKLPLNGVDNLEGYFRRAMLNIMRNRWRRSRVHARAMQRMSQNSGPVDDRELVDKDEIVVAVRKLPTKQRQAVTLRFFMGLSVAETARELGVSEGTVKAAVSRACDALKPLLEGEQYGS